MEKIPDGYTRVSEILSIFQSYAHVPKDKLKRAQDVGTDVHEAIETYLKGDFIPLGSKLSPYFDSFLHWVQNVKMTPILMEERLFDHGQLITGRIDLLAEIDGKNVLVDFKTGSWAHPEIWKLQGTFYRGLLEGYWLGNDGPEMPDKFLFIQLQRDGSPPILFNFDFDPLDVAVCTAALRCYHYFKKTS